MIVMDMDMKYLLKIVQLIVCFVVVEGQGESSTYNNYHQGNSYNADYYAPPSPSNNDQYNQYNQEQSQYDGYQNGDNQQYPPSSHYNNGYIYYDNNYQEPPSYYQQQQYESTNSPPPYTQDYGYQNTDYNGYQNTSPSPPSPSPSPPPPSPYGVSRYDKDYQGNYYTEVQSPPILQSPPPAFDPSVLPSSSNSDQLFNFLMQILDVQNSQRSVSDIERLAKDTDGYWGWDVVEGWKGNIQYEQTDSLLEEQASIDNDYTLLSAGLLDFDNVCTDQNPYNMIRSCREIADDGKCWEEEFVKDHICDKTCGRDPCPNVCDDLLPEDFDGVYECWELTSDCDTSFMIDNNYCASTCKRAPCALP